MRRAEEQGADPENHPRDAGQPRGPGRIDLGVGGVDDQGAGGDGRRLGEAAVDAEVGVVSDQQPSVHQHHHDEAVVGSERRGAPGCGASPEHRRAGDQHQRVGDVGQDGAVGERLGDRLPGVEIAEGEADQRQGDDAEGEDAPAEGGAGREWRVLLGRHRSLPVPALGGPYRSSASLYIQSSQGPWTPPDSPTLRSSPGVSPEDPRTQSSGTAAQDASTAWLLPRGLASMHRVPGSPGQGPAMTTNWDCGVSGDFPPYRTWLAKARWKPSRSEASTSETAQKMRPFWPQRTRV